MRAPHYWNPELDTKPWGEVLDWQAAQLPALLERLAAGSPFYRRRLPRTDVRDFAGLSELPLVTKHDLRELQQHAGPERPYGEHQVAPTEAIVQTLSSSGTTGEPTYYALTAADRLRWTSTIANVFFTAGVRPEDTVGHVVGTPILAGGLPYADGMREIGANLAWIGGLSTERILRATQQLRISVLNVTPSFAVHLTDRCEEILGRRPSSLGVRRLIGGGEPGLGQPQIRARLRDAWAVERVSECMGLGDVLAGMWGECDAGTGMHFCAADHVAVELLDPDSLDPVPWSEGARGELVYTTLARDATPVLRFRSGDHALVTSVGCSCGRTAPTIRVVGRTDDMLIYKAMNVFPAAMRDVILEIAGGKVGPALRFRKSSTNQVAFDRPIPVEIEARDHVESRQLDEIARRIERAVRDQLQVRVAVEFRAEIPAGAYKNSLVYAADEG